MRLFECMGILLVVSVCKAGQFGIIEDDNSKQSCLEMDAFVKVNNISSVVSSHSIVRICPLILRVETVITLEGVQNVTFDGGMGKRSTLRCSKKTGGFKFVNSFNISLLFLKIVECSLDSTERNLAAILFVNCAGILLHQVDITESSGVGLTLYNANGIVVVENCLFEMNSQHILIQSQLALERSEYSITNSTFSSAFLKSTFGGGLGAIFNSSQATTFTVSSVAFEGNRAKKGGGMSIRILSSSKIEIKIKKSLFTNNKAIEGGGLHVESQSAAAAFNLTVTQCEFDGNHATLGGGSIVSSAKTSTDNSFITFDGIRWHNNMALYGAAFCAMPVTKNTAALRGILPRLKLYNAVFQSNIAKKHYLSQNQYVEEYIDGIGALYCIEFELYIFDSLLVTNNNGSGFRLEHTTMYVKENTSALFVGNEGYYGGAVYLLTSRMILSDNVKLNFTFNTAQKSGGGIHYYTTSNMWTTYSDSCFISKASSAVGNVNIELIFDRNYNTKFSYKVWDAIKVLSLVPCLRHLNKNENGTHNDSRIFESIGYFSFFPEHVRHVHTSVKSFTITNIQEETVGFVPGKSRSISIKSYSDLVSSSYGIFTVGMKESNGIKVFPNAIVSGSSLTLYGKQNEQGSVLLSTKSARRVTVGFEVKLVSCPAGFAIGGLKNECICITSPLKGTTHGIESCDNINFTASRVAGMWVKHSINQTDLESGYCPSGYCRYNTTLNFVSDDPDVLEICQHGRKGILCGECRSNFTVYFHNRYYACGPNSLCKLGWLFYILTEIVPVTILFVIILYKDQSLSSGPANGFIFFAQVLLTMRIGGEGYFKLPSTVKLLQGFLPLFYGMFNLDFFVQENLAFCLWKNATTLSVMAINYLTQIYSLGLVVAVVAILNYSLTFKSLLARFGIKVPILNKSMVHGITAFLILTYSQNVTISMAILRPGYISKNNGGSLRVVHYMGVYNYSTAVYIPFAVTAGTSLVIFAVIPTLLLVLYPVHYKILHLLRLPETFFIWKLVNLLEILKPIFDSFQSTFKDNFRFFSGVYFLYRFLIQLAFNINTPVSYYITMEVLLTVVLVVHAVFQPHKERHHNVIDGLLMGDLLLINTFSLYHLSYRHYPNHLLLPLAVSCPIQMVFAFIPLVILLIVCVKKLCIFLGTYVTCRHWCMKSHLERDDLDEFLELESTRNEIDLQSSSYGLSSSYSSLSVSKEKNKAA